MDFHEFLVKKKIDRTLFSAAQPELYREFEFEYGEMGPKSFDHTKKYLFNNLRRTYHLKTELRAPATEMAPADLSAMQEPLATQAEPLSSPTIVQQPAFTPRFRKPAASPADNPPVKGGESANTAEQSARTQESSLAGEELPGLPVPQKPAFTPRFRKPAASPADNPPVKGEESANTAEQSAGTQPDSAANMPSATATEPVQNLEWQAPTTDSTEHTTSGETPAQPTGLHVPAAGVYKPRFKPVMIRKPDQHKPEQDSPKSDLGDDT